MGAAVDADSIASEQLKGRRDLVPSMPSDLLPAAASEPAAAPVPSCMAPETINKKKEAVKAGGKTAAEKPKSAKKKKVASAKGRKKRAKVAPPMTSPFLRAVGPPAPFSPGLVLEPGAWELRNAVMAQAYLALNPVAHDRAAAVLELSVAVEVAERAKEVLEFVHALPSDRIAGALMQQTLQEVRYRRPFLQIPAPARARGEVVTHRYQQCLLSESLSPASPALGSSGRFRKDEEAEPVECEEKLPCLIDRPASGGGDRVYS